MRVITVPLEQCSSGRTQLYPLVQKAYTPAKDLSVLLWLAEKTPGNIVEVGCNEGITTLNLAYNFPTKLIYGVDCSTPGTVPLNQQAEQPSAEKLGWLAKPMPNARIHDMPLSLCFYGGTQATMFFLDADHSYESVKEQSARIFHYLKVDAPRGMGRRILAWHDYVPEGMPHAEWVGVGRYVRELAAISVPIYWANETTVAWIILPD